MLFLSVMGMQMSFWVSHLDTEKQMDRPMIGADRRSDKLKNENANWRERRKKEQRVAGVHAARMDKQMDRQFEQTDRWRFY